MRKLLLLTLLIGANTVLFAQGINFFEGTFMEALKQAQKENKKVFVDVYTDW